MIKEVYKKNMKSLGLLEGDYIERKGTEIWDSVYSFAAYDNLKPIDREVLIDTLKNISNLYVYKIKYTEDGVEKAWAWKELADIKKSEKLFPADKVIQMAEENRIISLRLGEKPSLLGYIDFSNYDSSLKGQTAFVQKLFTLKDYVLETDRNNIIDLKHENEFEIVYGHPLVPKGLERHFNGRSNEFNKLELEDFWDGVNLTRLNHKGYRRGFVCLKYEKRKVALT